MTKHVIKAEQNTWLKKTTADSHTLATNKKVLVPAGKTYSVTDFKKAENGHWLVTLDYGAGDWYIFDPAGDKGHWDTTWEQDENDEPCNSIGHENLTGNVGRIDWNDNTCRVSKYFSVGEVTNNSRLRIPKPNSNELKNILRLAQELDLVRECVGSPIRVNSWFRPSRRLGYPVDVNAKVGGARNSQHIYGLAVDISMSDVNRLIQLEDYLLRNWRGGVGTAARNPRKRFIHLDGRSGFPCFQKGSATATWTY